MLDLLLAAILLVAVPLHALLRSRSQHDRRKRYRQTVTLIVVLLGLLALNWSINGRSIVALGLEAPTSTGALIGLCLAILFLLAMASIARRHAPSPAALTNTLLPVTPEERRAFVPVVLAAGIGWELLYRGFLLFFLTPHIGVLAAVLLAALSYALAHAPRDARQALGAAISALLFCVAYTLTGSLWWLIILHVGMPLTTIYVRQPSEP